MLEIELTSGADHDVVRILGVFPFVQVTYRSVRVGKDGETTVLDFDLDTHKWRDPEGNQWSDFTVRPAPTPPGPGHYGS